MAQELLDVKGVLLVHWRRSLLRGEFAITYFRDLRPEMPRVMHVQHARRRPGWHHQGSSRVAAAASLDEASSH